MWFLGAKGHMLIENMSFSGYSAGLHHQNHPVVVGRILDSSRLAVIIASIEFARLLYLQHFAGKRPSYASCKSGSPTSVHRRGMRPLAEVYIRNTCRSFSAAMKPLLKKMKYKLNRWSPTAQQTPTKTFQA
jgi:hypothetical protein